ncbi:phosphoesterase [Muricauda sp. JGD-17]|uniref:Phosphoesterase n=1 Tax=Flagellimonas ochracea TaxID=2696472 RepID=A0A964TBZ2_9FLAO|nr:metallophosphoesterase [Allomuricauda ochracea]NAY92057.1 phosphoesterase [Allomuricauda ochracea]
MKKHYVLFSLLFLIFSCATYKPKYAEPFVENGSNSDKEIEHTFYLIGDAGKSPIGGMNNALKAFKTELDKADKNSTAIFLGDNIYPAGLPDKKDSTRAYLEAKNHLDAQLATLDNFKGKRVFIPGNHDWYTEGLVGLKRQEKYVEKQLNSKEVFFPENGCPMETIEIGDDIVVIVIDTEWYLTNWDKRPDINDECEIKDRERFFVELEDEIKDYRQKTTIIAMHHPMFSYGPHGGQYAFKKHLYPNNGKVPMPILGTLVNILRRTSGASIADIQNKKYNTLKKRLLTLAQSSEKVILVSGHEHTLQYIVEENTPQIVSGSGAKKGHTRLLNGSKFSTGHMGYAILKVFKDGSSHVDFYSVDDDVESPIFSSIVLPADRKETPFSGAVNFPSNIKASIYTKEEVEKTNFFKAVWGERYRKYYGTEVKVPVVNLDTLYGGLKPIRKGGGHQSKSLRLEHSDGRQFVMRALRKSAELYLQAIAFKDQYVVGEFEDTFTEKLLSDFYTGAHPYAPFTIGKLSDAVGIYHTNPKLFYVPKQRALEDFNTDFGDELYMIEEHVSEGHKVPSLGYAKKIESTTDVIDKLRRDEEYKLDSRSYVRARLFDMLIGDWDRHPDQWRWLEVDDGEGNTIFKPIPRDRDQAFSIMGDGALMGLASKVVPSLQLFEGYSAEIRSVKGFNSSPKTFALDMALLSQTSLNDWIEEARYIQNKIDGSVVDSAFQAFPEEVRDETVSEIKRILLARKKDLVNTAKKYFRVINKFSVITGTDKDDHFVITPRENGGLDVKAFRIKDGKKTDLFFNRQYDSEYTKEIWVYGLDDDDVFEILGNEGKIKIRLIGGHNNDIYKIAKKAKRVDVYDFKAKNNTYDEAFGGNIHRRNDYETNTYQFNKIKASNNQILPSLGFNPDDGFRIGLSNTYTYNGFGQNPFTQRHIVNAAFYFATSGYDIGYKGEFANIANNVNVELAAKFTSPNFSINFFGFGNETPNFDDDLGLDFNRVKIRTLKFAPSLVWRGHLGSKVRVGVSYENYDIEETENRFIEGWFTDNGQDTEQDFFGVDAEYAYSNSDNEAFPTMGMAFSLIGGYKTNLSDTSRAFAFIIPSLSFDYKISSDGRLVLATKFKGHFNFGDEFEFYQAASIGANNGLRGFRFQRFTGKTAYYQNTDLRYSFRKTQTGLLPVTPGVFSGFDYGRVWFPNQSSDKWHNSYGGGFFVNASNIITANLGLFNSTDGLRFSFGLGFGF